MLVIVISLLAVGASRPPLSRPSPVLLHLDAFVLVPDTWSGFGFEGQGWLVSTPSRQARFLHLCLPASQPHGFGI